MTGYIPEEFTEADWIAFRELWADPVASKAKMRQRFGIGQKRMATIARLAGLPEKPPAPPPTRPWPPEQEARLRALWADQSLTLVAVADALNLPLGKVSYRAEALGLPRKPSTRDKRSAEARDEIVRLWRAGKSAREIGDQLGMTRNAVIGVIHRAGLGNKRENPFQSRPKKPPIHKPRKAKAMPKLIVCGGGNTVLEKPDAGPPKVTISARAWEALPGSDPKPLTHATGCKWPIGDEPLFCCLPVEGEGAYCPEHKRRSLAKVQPEANTPNKLARQLRKWAA